MPIRCVIGLGNPGIRYRWTRHNAGFWVLDRLAHDAGLEWEKQDSVLEAAGTIDVTKVVLAKPQTYMNRSGEAVRALMQRHALSPEEMLVVVDDVALPAGRLRVRVSGSAGGHRGLLSIEESIESRAYSRLRVGVEGDRAEEDDLAEYVLRPLDEDEKVFFRGIAERGVEAVRVILRDGISKAMNRFNPAGPETGDRPAARAGEPDPA
jgi:PTH1 family peptidyl-tRNA hydrolase